MGALRLVHPTTQDDIDLNQQRISHYLAKLVRTEFDQPVWELFFTDALRFLEVWYWFDPINLSHSIAIVGEDFEATPDPAVAAVTWHFRAPISLFSIIRIRGNCSDLEAAEMGRIFQDVEWRRVTGHEFDQMDRASVLANWRTEDDKVVLSSGKKFAHGAAASLRELTKSPEFSAPGEDWSALLVLVTSFNRIPAVPIAKAATLLQIEEKTVRNRIDRNELEAIPRKGTIWVTLRSIKHYLKTHYRATATFDLWSEVEAALKGKKGNFGNPGTF